MAADGTRQSVLVADIGGTNARFALADVGASRPRLHQSMKLPAGRFASLSQAAKHYLSDLPERPSRAAIAVACPVAGDEIRLTNRAWSFNREALRRELGLDELMIINDFGAAAHAVPVLEEQEYVLFHGPDHSDRSGPVSVLGPGTGFGVALLMPPEAPGRNWQVLETEGGHVSFAPSGTEESRIHEWLLARHARVSIERVLSGQGLSKIHAALAGASPMKAQTPDDQLRKPGDIVAAALKGEDRLARQTLARFCAILGSVAGDTALIHGASTLAISGGIVPRFIPFLRSSAFRERFLDKGRLAAYLEAVRIVVVTHPYPGLLGAAMVLARKSAVAGSCDGSGRI